MGFVLDGSNLFLHHMESRGFYPKILMSWSHAPSLMLPIGAGCYVFESLIGSGRDGVLSPLAWIVWGVCAAGLFLTSWDRFKKHTKILLNETRRISLLHRAAIITAVLFLIVMLLVGLRAAAYPPHLSQEYDVINYHYTLPRQHLIRGDWGWIPFLSADLFVMPLDYALAPYYLSNELMNKLPQFVFYIGVLFMTAACCWRLSRDHLRSFWAMAAVAGSHGLAVQLGTAMFDVVMLYLILAALHSLWSGHEKLAAMEASFFFWSKPFVPIQWMSAWVVLWIGMLAVRKSSFSVSWGFDRARLMSDVKIKRFFIVFMLWSAIVAGPFLMRSAYYAKTPLYPFFVGLGDHQSHEASENTAHQALAKAAESYMQVRHQYGHGRSFTAWLKHFWLIAVPEHGVNNSFDYPLGLPYLLCAGPFLWYFGRALFLRSFPLLPITVIVLWTQWWLGSQQSRFLFAPLVLLLICVVQICPLRPALYGGLVLAVLMTTVSVVRAHRHDFGKASLDVLRPMDRRAVMMSRVLIENGFKNRTIVWPNHEAAFLRVPFRVRQPYWPWVIPYRSNL